MERIKNKTTVIPVLTAALCAAFIACGTFNDPPNVVFIVVDTLRVDHLGCYGYERNTSPHIDALSRESVVFKNALAQAPWTPPSIASMLTGLYPAELGYKDRPVVIEDSIVTMAEIFQANGYATKGIISHVLVAQRLGFAQGFDSYDQENAEGHGHISSPSVIQKAVEFIKNHRNNKYFLFLHLFDPHYDYIQHDEHNFFPGYSGTLQSGESIYSLREKAPDMTEQDLEYVKALYDSEIRFTDAYIGHLLNTLKELDLYRNTMVVLTADHGEEFKDRDDWIGHSKRVYQESIHVPLIIKLPGRHKQIVIEDYTGLIDVMPSIIRYMDFYFPGEYPLSGSIIDFNGKKKRDSMVFSETRRGNFLRTAIWQGWKLIDNRAVRQVELYNLQQDPRESSNAADSHPELAQKLLNALNTWSENTRTNLPSQSPSFTEEELQKLKSLGYIK
jgi:arylsulfatase A-like enzyme